MGMNTESQSFLGKPVFVKIDRPLGSQHPQWEFIYELNYGFVPDVFSPDGEELDAYVLGAAQPLDTFWGICIAVIHRLNDQDDELVLAPEGIDFSDAQIRLLTQFQEKFFTSVILRPDANG